MADLNLHIGQKRPIRNWCARSCSHHGAVQTLGYNSAALHIAPPKKCDATDPARGSHLPLNHLGSHLPLTEVGVGANVTPAFVWQAQ